MAKFRKKPVVVEGRGPLTVSEMVTTAHGRVRAEAGDYVLQDPDTGDTWPIKPDIFEATYEPVVWMEGDNGKPATITTCECESELREQLRKLKLGEARLRHDHARLLNAYEHLRGGDTATKPCDRPAVRSYDPRYWLHPREWELEDSLLKERAENAEYQRDALLQDNELLRSQIPKPNSAPLQRTHQWLAKIISGLLTQALHCHPGAIRPKHFESVRKRLLTGITKQLHQRIVALGEQESEKKDEQIAMLREALNALWEADRGSREAYIDEPDCALTLDARNLRDAWRLVQHALAATAPKERKTSGPDNLRVGDASDVPVGRKSDDPRPGEYSPSGAVGIGSCRPFGATVTEVENRFVASAFDTAADKLHITGQSRKEPQMRPVVRRFAEEMSRVLDEKEEEKGVLGDNNPEDMLSQAQHQLELALDPLWVCSPYAPPTAPGLWKRTIHTANFLLAAVVAAGALPKESQEEE